MTITPAMQATPVEPVISQTSKQERGFSPLIFDEYGIINPSRFLKFPPTSSLSRTPSRLSERVSFSPAPASPASSDSLEQITISLEGSPNTFSCTPSPNSPLPSGHIIINTNRTPTPISPLHHKASSSEEISPIRLDDNLEEVDEEIVFNIFLDIADQLEIEIPEDIRNSNVDELIEFIKQALCKKEAEKKIESHQPLIEKFEITSSFVEEIKEANAFIRQYDISLLQEELNEKDGILRIKLERTGRMLEIVDWDDQEIKAFICFNQRKKDDLKFKGTFKSHSTTIEINILKNPEDIEVIPKSDIKIIGRSTINLSKLVRHEYQKWHQKLENFAQEIQQLLEPDCDSLTEQELQPLLNQNLQTLQKLYYLLEQDFHPLLDKDRPSLQNLQTILEQHLQPLLESNLQTSLAQNLQALEDGSIPRMIQEIYQLLENEITITKQLSTNPLTQPYVSEILNTPHKYQSQKSKDVKMVLYFTHYPEQSLAKFQIPNLETILRQGISLCRGLQIIHDQGIVLRDIKPQNILISEDEKYVFSDCGYALDLSKASEGQKATPQGTYTYFSPEALTRMMILHKNNGERIQRTWTPSEIEENKELYLDSLKKQDEYALYLTILEGLEEFGEEIIEHYEFFYYLIALNSKLPYDLEELKHPTSIEDIYEIRKGNTRILEEETPGFYECVEEGLQTSEVANDPIYSKLIGMFHENPEERTSLSEAIEALENMLQTIQTQGQSS